MTGNRFVLVACGEAHVQRANFCIRSLRKYAPNANIIAVQCRAKSRIQSDECYDFDFPELDDARCSRALKTGVFEILGPALTDRGTFCYLDTDVFAVSDRSETIFDRYQAPVMFGLDSGKTVRRFSSYAMRRGSLKDGIRRAFGVRVTSDWPIWNGGVYLFDRRSTDFLRTWHEWTMQALKDPAWKPRDQGTLVAAVWRHGLQDHATLDPEFHWLHKLKRGLKPQRDGFRNKRGDPVHFVHFPVTYGDPRSESWNRLMSLIGDPTPVHSSITTRL